MVSINSLPPEVLTNIFNKIPTLTELFAISATCRLWHSVIMDEWFLQQRFERFKKENIIGHWKFDDASDIGRDSSGYTKSNYSIIGQPTQSDCFLGKSIQLDGRSMISIPVKDLDRYQTDHFAVSCWIYCDKTFSSTWQVPVGSWFDWSNSWFHLGFDGQQTLHNQILISKKHQYQFNCHSKTKVQTER
jgi:hypothetical protein